MLLMATGFGEGTTEWVISQCIFFFSRQSFKGVLCLVPWRRISELSLVTDRALVDLACADRSDIMAHHSCLYLLAKLPSPYPTDALSGSYLRAWAFPLASDWIAVPRFLWLPLSCHLRLCLDVVSSERASMTTRSKLAPNPIPASPPNPVIIYLITWFRFLTATDAR